MQEIAQTEQMKAPPAPPRPAPPVEVPNDRLIEDEVINLDASLDLNERMDVGAPPASAPPPPPEEAPNDEDEIFIVVEEQPELIGGMASLSALIQYPPLARRTGVEGRVFIQFVVNKNGNVTDPVVMKSPHTLLSEEAIRVIKQAKFKPGRQRGRAVNVKMALPINFRIQDRSN